MLPRRRFFFVAVFAITPSLTLAFSRAAEPLYRIGVASIDVTPDYPVRMSGYSNRKMEFEGVEQPIHAKALAIAAGDDAPAVLITVDSLGVSAAMTDAVAARLKEAHGIPREKVA